jgi:hypothetical protein
MTIEEAEVEIDRLTGALTREKEHKSAADRNVSKHLKEVERLQAIVDDKTPADPPGDNPANPPAPNVSDREKNLDRRERAFKLATERGINPSEAMSILGLDDDDDGAKLDAHQSAVDEAAQTATDKVLRENGRSEIGGGVKLDYALPDMGVLEADAKAGGSQWRRYSPEALADSAEAAEKRPTLRQRLADRIGGGSR